MSKILLACSAGMSTSMLVQKMEDYAKSQKIDVYINALPTGKALLVWEEYDAVLLGPQVSFEKARFNKVINGKIPLEVIDMRLYGTMNGEEVLKNILEKIK